MRHLVLFGLVLLAAGDAGARDRRCYSRGDRNGECASYAFFEFLPANGTGTTGVACSTTAPTGVRGEVQTFTGPAGRMCTKTAAGGLSTTGIANGDLISMGANVARLEWNSSGVLSELIEGQRVNSCLRSEELDDAAWVYVNTGAATPIFRGSNVAVSPAGTTTAEGFSFPATSAGQDSVRAAGTTAALNGVSAYSIFVKGCLVQTDGGCILEALTPAGDGGVLFPDGGQALSTDGGSGSGTLDVCRYGSATAECTAVAYNAVTWTRGIHIRATSSGEASNIAIGNSTRWNGGTARDSNSVFLWGGDGEAGAYATSYPPTGSGTTTRTAETAYLPLTSPSGAQSIAASWEGPGATLAGARIFALTQNAGSTNYGVGVYHNSTTNYGLAGTAPTTITSGTAQASPSRIWSSWNGTTLTVNADGAAATSTPGAISVPSRNSISVGLDSSGASHADGLISQVCLDPDSLRCR